MNSLLTAALTVLVALLAGCGASPSEAGAGGTVASPAPASDRSWLDTAHAPLSPRHGVAAAWTGNEVVLVGGDMQAPCPPGADCAYSPRPSADSAAYDPSADEWRSLPAAPNAIAQGHAVWTGEEVVVVGSGKTLALDPDAETWRTLDPSPRQVGDFVVVTDDGIVFVAYDQGPGERPVDWLLDSTTGQWSALPHDPFGESYDRSMAWDGERLWLLSMDVADHFAAHDGAPSRLAVLEDGEWRVVAEETPALTYEQDVWWQDQRLVVPAGSFGGVTRIYEPASEEWSMLQPAGDLDCRTPAAGVGDHWLSGGGAELLAAAHGEAVGFPPCPPLNETPSSGPDVAVWAGDSLFIWGSDFSDQTTAGLQWTPPIPK